MKHFLTRQTITRRPSSLVPYLSRPFLIGGVSLSLCILWFRTIKLSAVAVAVVHDVSLRASDGETINKLKLRFDWANLEPTTELGKRMKNHQNNCSLPMGTFLYRNRYGLGSDLHVWGHALCNGMHEGLRLRTVGNWTWMDQTACGGASSSDRRPPPTTASPMLCYFPEAELNCPGDVAEALHHPEFDVIKSLSRPNGNVQDLCTSIYQGSGGRIQVRRSAMEFLMTRLHPRVVQEAERQLNIVFRGRDRVPENLITVHIRWGDKGQEMRLVHINKYIKAVRSILDSQVPTAETSHSTANIYLATEDPKAVQKFLNNMPPEWNLYVDQAHIELLPHRVEKYNGSPKMSKALDGRPGLLTLASILVAMEANYFVLTTESSFSRVMNEIRQTILDSRCGKCTSMIDLRRVRDEW